MTTLTGSSDQLSVSLLGLMHEFRHEVFVKRLGWSLASQQGGERDQYDTPAARYIVVRDERQRITGCARLLPTTGRYMLAELFPQLLGNGLPPVSTGLWELSRFATSVRSSREGRVLSLSQRTLDLLLRVFKLAHEHDVGRLVAVTSIGIERLMLRSGINVHRAGPPASIGDVLCVALFIEVHS